MIKRDKHTKYTLPQFTSSLIQKS